MNLNALPLAPGQSVESSLTLTISPTVNRANFGYALANGGDMNGDEYHGK